MSELGSPTFIRKPTDEQVIELANWLSHIGDQDAEELAKMPEWYKPTAAYYELVSISGGADPRVSPWDVPADWIEYMASVWCAKLIASRIVNNRNRTATAHAPSSRSRSTRGNGPGIV